MTAKEAIEIIKWRKFAASKMVGIGEDGKAFEDMEIAIEALKKRDAKKVLTNNEGISICPSCKAKQSGDTYCGKCGQKLKWW